MTNDQIKNIYGFDIKKGDRIRKSTGLFEITVEQVSTDYENGKVLVRGNGYVFELLDTEIVLLIG